MSSVSPLDTEEPRVSIIMATYNCVQTAREAVDSIACQTYSNWQLVVCDDGSTDGTFEVLCELAVEMPGRMRLLRNERNRQLAYSLNRCLEEASGQFIARMDGDDISEPERLQRQVGYLMQHPEVDLVGTAMRRFNDEGVADVLALPERPDRFSLHSGVPFAHATIMARKAVFDELGGYTVAPRTARAEDVDLWGRFFATDFVGRNLPEPLYRVREDMGAIQRRTFKSRIQTYRTVVVCYRRLGYPWHWYAESALVMVGKGLTPSWLMLAHRKWQARRFARVNR
jgi:glycosyltransferase EpsE